MFSVDVTKGLKMLIRVEAQVIIESMWEEKMKWVSKVTPSMQGLLFRGNRNDNLII